MQVAAKQTKNIIYFEKNKIIKHDLEEGCDYPENLELKENQLSCGYSHIIYHNQGNHIKYLKKYKKYKKNIKISKNVKISKC